MLRKLLQKIDFDGLLTNRNVSSNMNQIMQTNSMQKKGFDQSILRDDFGGGGDADKRSSSLMRFAAGVAW
jgi:hypothetical protein